MTSTIACGGPGYLATDLILWTTNSRSNQAVTFGQQINLEAVAQIVTQAVFGNLRRKHLLQRFRLDHELPGLFQ